TVSLAVASSRSAAATRAPLAARASAMPRPRPEPAPVTTAVRSLKFTVPPHPALSPERARAHVCDPLDGEGVAVAPRVGARHQSPGFGIAHDPLPATHDP